MSGFGSTEILQIADAVGREKNIDRNLVLEAMEDSIAIAARKKYGYGRNIHSKIDHETGEISLYRQNEVVANDFQPEEEGDEEEGSGMVGKITIDEAKIDHPDIKIGEVITDPLPPIDLGRVAAQTAKQVIIQKIRDAERSREFDDYESRAGQIVSGTVKRVEFGHIILDLGNAEAIITKDQAIRGESFRLHDRVRAYVDRVSREKKGAQIFLSRTSPEFMRLLFAQEVPEIYDGLIEVKSVSREPGSRAKVAVYAIDGNIDVVGSCVGIRGSRVQAITAELSGEKIDIIEWSSDPATFLVNALTPADVTKVVIDEDKHRVAAVVPEDQLSLAIGRRGQNVRLASQLMGWNIDVMGEDDESSRRSEEVTRITALFIDALDVDDLFAHLLVTENFTTVEEIAYVDASELVQIEGFNEDIAAELQQRANNYLESQKQEQQGQADALKIDKSLQSFEPMSHELKIALAEHDIKTLDQFAELARDEFVELIPESGLEDDAIDALIMQARSHWFEEGQDDESADKTADKSDKNAKSE